MLALLMIFLVIVLCLNLKQNIIGKTITGGTNDIEGMVTLKYLSNFWRTLQISSINNKNNLILTWSENFVIPEAAKQATAFAITDTLSTQEVLHKLLK